MLSSVVFIRDCTELCRPVAMLCNIVRTVLCYVLVLCCLIVPPYFVQIFALAISLGGHESLVELP